jgi:osmotically inducible protein OsmC
MAEAAAPPDTDDGQSAIFRSVIKLAAGKKKARVPADLVIDAEVDLGTTGEAYGLATASTSACRVSSAKLPRNWSDAAEQLRGLR